MSAVKPMPSFYQRQLPETCIAFASKEGKKIFASSLASRGLKSFFVLIQQFTTQSEPAYCGLSSLVLVLNALAVDPLQNWRGPWRWYEEKMLNCCFDLNDVKRTGITLSDFQCLARCQGLSVEITYCDEQCTLEKFRSAVQRACVETDKEDGHMEAMVVSYSRKVVGQTGSGHFSPLAAYDPESDSVLILDTARFKYGAHWVKLPLIYEAMKPIDPDTGRSRGYCLLSFIPHNDHHFIDTDDNIEASLPPVSVLFRSKMTQQPARREYKEFLAKHTNELTWDEAVAYWTADKTKVPTVWSILEPLRLPVDSERKEQVQNLRVLLHDLLEGHDAGPFKCCEQKLKRQNCVSEKDALYVIYLSSLPKERREELVMGCKSDAPMSARIQLLNEAELIANAISFSDESTY